MKGQWQEVPSGGSWEAEAEHFERLARDILRVQFWNQRRVGASRLLRAFQAKTLVEGKSCRRCAKQ